MRILLVQESDWAERGPHQQHHLMERLQERGHQIRVIDYEIDWRKKLRGHILSPRSDFLAMPKICENSSIRVIRPRIIKMPLLDFVSIPFAYGREILGQMKSFKPDIVIGLGVLNTYIAMRICKLYSLPFTYYLIDALHTLIPQRRLRLLGKMLEGSTLRLSDRILVINRQLKEYAIGMGADPKKVAVLGAGIDTERFNPRVDGGEIRRTYGIHEDETVLFFMGWLYEFSGLREVAHSLLNHNNNPKIKLLILGKGELHEELLNLKKGNLDDKLILVDWQPYEKVPKYIAASDICLLPSHYDEIMKNIVPIKIYEYMACGKPVVTTRLPGIMREFGEGNGVVYANNADEVLDISIKLSKNKAKLAELGSKAANQVSAYSWEKITAQFEEILKAIRREY
jgi:glycosyltransferase involved in cell wall biosynthesis